MDFWKKPHTNREPINERQAEFKAIIFINFSLRVGVNNNIKIPKIGNSRI
jgi:hypothetical protein